MNRLTTAEIDEYNSLISKRKSTPALLTEEDARRILELEPRANYTRKIQIEERQAKIKLINDELDKLELFEIETDDDTINQTLNLNATVIENLPKNDVLLKRIYNYIEEKQNRPDIKITKLKEDNWLMFIFELDAKFQSFGLDHFINKTFDEKDHEKPLFKYLDKIAKNQLLLNVSDTYRKMVMQESTTQKMVDKLKVIFEGGAESKCSELMVKWYSLIGSEDLEKLVNGLKEVIQGFEKLFDEGDDKDIIWRGTFLAALPNQFNHLRTTLASKKNCKLEEYFELSLQEYRLQKSNDKSNSTMMNSNLVKNNYKKSNHNQQKNSYSNNSNFQHSKNYSNNQQKNNYKSIDHKETKSPKNYKNVHREKLCLFCNGDHVIKDCEKANEARQLLEEKNKSNKSRKIGNLNKVELSKNEEKIDDRTLMFNFSLLYEDEVRIDNVQQHAANCSNLELHKSKNKTTWFLDSGATDHMCNDSVPYQQLRMIDNGENVLSAAGDVISIVGMANLVLNGSNEAKISLKNVVVCPSLTANFLSASQLDLEGYTIAIGGQICKVIKDGVVLMEGTLTNSKLYKMNVSVDGGSVPNINNLRLMKNDDKVMYYHRLFGHVNFKDLKRMESKFNIKVNTQMKCYKCIKSKAKRLPFDTSRKEIATDRPLALVHMDLSGKINVPNLGNYNYFLLCIDDYSRFTFVYILKCKSEVFKIFKNFKNLLENQLDMKIKAVRSDNGTEFVNNNFTDLYEQSGIVQQLTTTYTPQLNAVSERGMGVVKQMARNLLVDSGIGGRFWPYAIMHAVYILNRTPRSSINFDIPFERLYNKDASIKNLHVFGCKVIYREETADNVFDVNGRDGIYLGNPANVKGYYVYAIDKKMVIINRNVYFIDKLDGQHESSDLLDFDLEDEEFCSLSSDATPLVLDKLKSINFDYLKEENDQNVYRDSENLYRDSNDLEELEQEIDTLEASVERVDDAQTDQEEIENTFDVNQEIVFNRRQKEKFLAENPGKKLEYVRGSNRKGRGKFSIYRIYSISLPRTLKQVNESNERDNWKEAMQVEYESMISNEVWELVDRPNGVRVLPGMWLYSIRTNLAGSIERYKARYVVLGNLQKLGKDIHETYAPVINEVSFRTVLALAVKYQMYIHQIDIKTAYLNAEIKNDVYVQQPPGFEIGDRVCKLKKALYGLRESALCWNIKLNETLKKLGFKRSQSDTCLFYGWFNKTLAIICIYVDDCAIAAQDIKLLKRIKYQLSKEFEITDKGELNHFLNLNIEYNLQQQYLYISQAHYIQQLLEVAGMLDCNPCKTPMALGTDVNDLGDGEKFKDVHLYQMILGKLIYLATHSRPDISYAVGKLCKYMMQPYNIHFTLLKRVLRYLKQTMYYKLKFEVKNEEVGVYVDADYGNDGAGKSTTGLVCLVNGCMVDWYSRSQKRVATSTCHAEVLSIADGISEVSFIHGLLNELDVARVNNYCVYNDNQAACKTITHGGGDFSKNKHYRITINYCRDMVQLGWLSVKHISGEQMLADYLTKPVSQYRLKALVEKCGLIDGLDRD